jgi:hypothetical protein
MVMRLAFAILRGLARARRLFAPPSEMQFRCPSRSKSHDCSAYVGQTYAREHFAQDWQVIVENAKLFIDTRNALRNLKGKLKHIVAA